VSRAELGVVRDFLYKAPVTQEIDKLAWIHLYEKQLLGARSRGRDVYYLPGGKREPGESDHAALIREIREELAVDLIPESIEYVGSFTAQADNKPEGTLVRMTCYSAGFQGGIAASAEIEEVIWMSYKDWERCSPVVRIILDWLKEKGRIE
jgi:ADP-ribose pyrophosphatase YjhB (NUDIX family)